MFIQYNRQHVYSRFCDVTLTLQFNKERSETNVVSQLVTKAANEVREKQAEKQQIRIVTYVTAVYSLLLLDAILPKKHEAFNY